MYINCNCGKHSKSCIHIGQIFKYLFMCKSPNKIFGNRQGHIKIRFAIIIYARNLFGPKELILRKIYIYGLKFSYLVYRGNSTFIMDYFHKIIIKHYQIIHEFV